MNLAFKFMICHVSISLKRNVPTNFLKRKYQQNNPSNNVNIVFHVAFHTVAYISEMWPKIKTLSRVVLETYNISFSLVFSCNLLVAKCFEPHPYLKYMAFRATRIFFSINFFSSQIFLLFLLLCLFHPFLFLTSSLLLPTSILPFHFLYHLLFFLSYLTIYFYVPTIS